MDPRLRPYIPYLIGTLVVIVVIVVIVVMRSRGGGDEPVLLLKAGDTKYGKCIDNTKKTKL